MLALCCVMGHGHWMWWADQSEAVSDATPEPSGCYVSPGTRALGSMLPAWSRCCHPGPQLSREPFPSRLALRPGVLSSREGGLAWKPAAQECGLAFPGVSRIIHTAPPRHSRLPGLPSDAPQGQGPLFPHLVTWSPPDQEAGAASSSVANLRPGFGLFIWSIKARPT